MLIDDMITELQKVRQTHGNVQVKSYTLGHGPFEIAFLPLKTRDELEKELIEADDLGSLEDELAAEHLGIAPVGHEF